MHNEEIDKFLIGLYPFLDERATKLCKKYYLSCIDGARTLPLITPREIDITLTIENKQKELVRKYKFELKNFGGKYNFYFFNKCLCPPSESDMNHIKGDLLTKIIFNFSGKSLFIEYLKDEARKLGGKDGWVWVIKTKEKKQKLSITHTFDNENPLMINIKDIKHGQPILGINMCDHIYYNQYGNTNDYIDSIKNIINWKFVQYCFDN